MKKAFSYTFFFLLLIHSVIYLQGQDIEALNRIKYINLPPIKYTISDGGSARQLTQFDIYGIEEIIYKEIQSKGIEVIRGNNIEGEGVRDNCQLGYCHVYHLSNLDSEIIDEIIIEFSDCNYEIIYQCKAKVRSMAAKRVTTAIAAGRGPIQQAIIEALAEFRQFNYQFDQTDPIKKVIIPISDWDKKKIKMHFKSDLTDFDNIEGVYQSLDVDTYSFSLAILKKSGTYDIIILDTDDESWKTGQIRGNVGIPLDSQVYKGSFSYTESYIYSLEIREESPKRYEFKFIDATTNEYFTLSFKKKLP